jgi:hypothetical protein
MKLPPIRALRCRILGRRSSAIVLGLFILLMTISFQPLAAAPLFFTPPGSITVTMHRLVYSAGGDTGIDCDLNPPDENWGCTWLDRIHHPQSIRPYPYTANPITVSIESDYLLDVVPQEMATYYHPTAIQAQAIAARTYAYYHIDQGSTINNSTQFQVFIPYKFESLTPAVDPDNPTTPCASSNLNSNQQVVCDAVARRYYLSPYPAGGSSFQPPADTEFFSDAWNRTSDGGEAYLMAVDDPISAACDADNFGHGHGMSQEGASRWARGHQCSYENAPTLPGNPAGSPWSVHWERAEQILFHYYPGTSLRNADDLSFWRSPYERWNPLSINWGTPNNEPPAVEHGGSYPVTIQVQNIGSEVWDHTPDRFWGLSYHCAKPGFVQIDSSNRVWAASTVPSGDPPYTFTLNINDIPNWGPGAYTLKFDMVFSATWGASFWFEDEQSSWPTYDVKICVDGSCNSPVFLPAIFKDY